MHSKIIRYLGAAVLSLMLLLCVCPASALEQIRKAVPPIEVNSGEPVKGMSFGQAAVLGLVEGLTEYLPVSSTGHLLIAERLLGIGDPPKQRNGNQHTKEAADAYAICIQAGAILAVLWLYAGRFRQMAQGIMGRNRAGVRMLVNTIAAFLPAGVIGLALHKPIKTYLFGPWPVVIAWFVGGLAILLFAFRRKSSGLRPQSGKEITDVNVRMALIIGLAQCVAMWPGVSRSLATIVGGMIVGLSTPAAVEFSFLLGMVTLGAATFFDAAKNGHEMLQAFDLASLSVGLAVAFVSAVISVKWMVSYLNRQGLELFGYYRLAVAVVAAILILGEVL